MQQSPSAVEEWLQIHRTLIEREAEFTDLAIKAVSGVVSQAELASARGTLMQTREQCTAAYERAFPKSLEQRTAN